MKDMVTLVEPLIPALRRYARSLVRDPAAADDLVQDCLERVIAKWSQRRDDGDLRTWVFRILHNLSLNWLRARARRGEHVPIEEVEDAEISMAANQEPDIQHRDLLAMLARLTEDQRSVLLLVSIEDLTYLEAAEVLSVPVGTVMSRLSRARQRLAQLLQAADQPSRLAGATLRRVK